MEIFYIRDKFNNDDNEKIYRFPFRDSSDMLQSCAGSATGDRPSALQSEE
jgi:hypothetical protein